MKYKYAKRDPECGFLLPCFEEAARILGVPIDQVEKDHDQVYWAGDRCVRVEQCDSGEFSRSEIYDYSQSL